MTNSLDILQLGHPLLRLQAETVEKIDDEALQDQLDQLLSFVIEKGGMGIAAPQVGLNRQIFILSSHPNARYPYAPYLPPFCVINPVILAYSGSIEKDWEGCLSLPGIRALVPRHSQIQVRYQNRYGEVLEKAYEGFIARVFQHEYDHLQGRVFLDRVEDTLDIMMEQEWQRQVASQYL